MPSLLLIALVILAVIIVALVFAKQQGLLPTPEATAKSAKVDCYVLRSSVLTPAERSFLGVLETLDFTGHRLFAKVRLADIFVVKGGLKGGNRQSAFNRIAGKHVDFLIVRHDDGAPVLGIELDDASHERTDRRERDLFVDEIFASAGLALLHIPARHGYALADVRRIIEAAMFPTNPRPAAANTP